MNICWKSNDLQPTCEKNQKSYFYKQALGTFASCLICFCSGTTYAITAVMLPQLREDKSIQYSPTYDAWIASSASLAMIIGSLVCGPILDSYGRKAAHIILGVPFIIGWICIASANSVMFILVGRILTGLATGSNKAVTLVYIGEISSPKYRSVALFIPAVTAHIGTIFSHVVGHYLVWNISAVVCAVPAILALITFIFLKESPLWLIAKGRTEEGIKTFRWFRGTDEESESELRSVLEKQNDTPNISVKETFNAVCTLSFITPMLLLTAIMLNVQFSGVNALIFYSQDIFDKILSHKADSYLLTLVMDCIRGTVSICMCLLGKFVSKNIVYHISNFGISISILALVACSVLKVESVWLTIICLVIYMVFSSAIVSTGWTYVPELLPNIARGFGSGLNSALSLFYLFILVYILPSFMNTYGVLALFGLYGVSTVIFGIILFFFLPKTNGKTLQSIEDGFKNNTIKQTRL